MASGNVPGATFFWERAPAHRPAAPLKNAVARYCVCDLAGERRGDLSAAPRADGSRLRTPRPRQARPNVPRMYRRVGGFWPSNRHRSLGLVRRSDATTRRRPEMRASTKGKHEIRKRFAVVIGVVAAGVMALGAQTGAQTQAPTPPPTCNGLAATIVGTDGNDSLTGTPGPDVIVGLGGSDFGISGERGNDVICGGQGGDLLTGGPGRTDCSARRAATRSAASRARTAARAARESTATSAAAPSRSARSRSRSRSQACRRSFIDVGRTSLSFALS